MKTDRITDHPFRNLDRPYRPTRTRIYTDEEFQQLLECAGDIFGEVLTALRQTGCRPSELCAVTAEHVDTESWCWVFDEHKTDRTGNSKVIWLTEEMVQLSRRLMEQHPEGALFRNSLGNPWNHRTISQRFRKLREHLGLDEAAVPYATRSLRMRWVGDEGLRSFVRAAVS